ncbi:MAG: ABC transporter substrate-binding protein [Aminobacterium sp.]|jgi:branched-chain amino acid transport system substrate-binding protein|uniref:Leucine-, isoleucine-, valine-, threonine-, and alanine-binding protein n=1 Tax=bioreactor metagenome TaxID=1076179 RepID=A0A645AEZ4_9ZZZZ|nr:MULTISPECIES: ABC transporter substrate-binding protein [unclassified Aminobacterium]MDD2206184.1 ABC transporter substrate-binding protein [Aminobacterium sp.]MDD3426437.1 ABC transporter substrate-binding protein [Aminobacterium sp.]MDD3707083.1 ABC transporter substrate-binding protein [Aminobacterium sp.]MDD4227972.1 ABC transporter substrate-binding protein [Aminobacterium sp.]MDD4551181.1 ABC transporter substrate-binding protein [Aminobacterium sp.]
MKLRRVALALAMVLLLTGGAFAQDTIRIGVYLPLTGQNAFGGQLELDGVKMAHEEIPEVMGKKIELIVVDNKSDKVESANAVKRLIEKEKVIAIIGTYGSSLAMAGGEVAEKAGIPVMGTSCTNPLVTQGKKYYFRACFIDPYQGAAAATYAIRELGIKKAAVLVDVSNDYSVGLAGFFKQSFAKLGGEIVSELKYNTGDQDFTAQLTEIISKKPGIMFIPSYFAEGAIIMKQAAELGAEFKIMGGDAMDNPEIVTIGGEAVEGFMHTTFPYDPSMKDMSPLAKQFTENWKKAHPDKDPNVNAALGYDSYLLVIDAIKRAGNAEPEAITKALTETKDFPGVTGNTTINETHDAEKEVGIVMIKEGKKTFIGTVKPEM